LLIRGADAADVADADERALKVNCNMAQAFEIPRENQSAYPGTPPQAQAAVARYPAASRIAAPGPTHDRIGGRIGSWNMGSAPGPRKRLNDSSGVTRDGPNPGSAIRPRLIVSVRFDKGSRLPV